MRLRKLIVAGVLVAAMAPTAAAATMGGPGNDTIIGTPKADVLTGGRGNDTIRSGGGPDFVEGGPGRDTCYVGPLDIVLSCEVVL